MDLNQRKLTKDEWGGIELPLQQDELRIVKLIIRGYHNVMVSENTNMSLLTYLKISNSKEIDIYIYTQYLEPELQKQANKFNFKIATFKKQKNIVKKKDLIRFANTDKNLINHKEHLFEFILIELIGNMYKNINTNKWLYYYYTIKVISRYNVLQKNQTLMRLISKIINELEEKASITDLVFMAKDIIESNSYLLKYADDTLYEHQKKLFTISKSLNPKLIQYIAPTGTGKTLSPLGLSEGHKIIFVCAARHVGLALAKAAISSNKKVAFAFGCGDAEDIRLHYSAAKDYKRNQRTGSIAKVDNTVGDLVEIMISDIKSYIPAMLYMLAFNKRENIILYWDEPTIALDYKEHEFHKIIQKNWRENLIPNVVLSSATLPQPEDMQPTIQDFKSRFVNAEVHAIISHDSKKTIPLIDKNGYIAMPHYLSDSYQDVKNMSKHCKKYKTLMRYIDFGEAIKFVKHVNLVGGLISDRYKCQNYFTSFETITMTNIKNYYFTVLQHIKPEQWSTIIHEINLKREKYHVSNINIVTKDAYTLTDGPTIFLADDIHKIGKFCLQQAEIPKVVIKDITEAISYNSVINNRVATLQKDYEDGTKEDEKKEKKISDGRVKPEMKRLLLNIEELQSCVKTVALDPLFIPNTIEHLERFKNKNKSNGTPFICNITEDIVEKIMLIDDIADSWKMLLLMGIGVFASHESIRYTEIMKKLAQQQKLYIIIASTDYIYGTNYQFCHSYISKDLTNMSQEKCIQAMGRVGRKKIQQDYSIRFRDDNLIKMLFTEEKEKPEVINMSLLFNS